jgi:Zn-dependent protease with chaperone function
MKGIALYAITLLIEQISVACRFLLVFAACGLFLPRNLSLALAVTAALAPLAYSLLVLCGLPSGHLLVRRALGGRRPDGDEALRIRSALERLPTGDGTRPRHIFVIDQGAVNACVAGTALYAYAGLMETKYLGAVLAHELGHLRGADGRLGLALGALVVPGAAPLAALLGWLMRVLSNALIWLLNGLIRLLRLYPLAGVLQVLVNIFLIAIPRYAIIFAMGGVGPRLIDFAWQGYFVAQEYRADAYAAQRGQRLLLVELFVRFQAALADVAIPWSARRTHPPLRARIVRLRDAAPPAERRQIDAMLLRFGYDIVSQQPAASHRAASNAMTPARTSLPLVVGALLLLALIGYGAINWLDAPPRLPTRPPAATPTLGPTPTLGF